MADDSLTEKQSIMPEKSKISNIVQRTTSETLRMEAGDKFPVNSSFISSSSSSGTTAKKKTTSFQITSVSNTVNDGGDESADDLDDSRTDELSDIADSSKMTDTPSYSEDAFLREDFFFNTSSSVPVGTAPVIPTSSQYGLAIVAEGAGLNVGSSIQSDVHVSVRANVIDLQNKCAERDNVHNRFKVVKIESTEPFLRGRWTCMDYLDHTSTAPAAVKDDAGIPATKTPSSVQVQQTRSSNSSDGTAPSCPAEMQNYKSDGMVADPSKPMSIQEQPGVANVAPSTLNQQPSFTQPQQVSNQPQGPPNIVQSLPPQSQPIQQIAVGTQYYAPPADPNQALVSQAYQMSTQSYVPASLSNANPPASTPSNTIITQNPQLMQQQIPLSQAPSSIASQIVQSQPTIIQQQPNAAGSHIATQPQMVNVSIAQPAPINISSVNVQPPPTSHVAPQQQSAQPTLIQQQPTPIPHITATEVNQPPQNSTAPSIEYINPPPQYTVPPTQTSVPSSQPTSTPSHPQQTTQPIHIIQPNIQQPNSTYIQTGPISSQPNPPSQSVSQSTRPGTYSNAPTPARSLLPHQAASVEQILTIDSLSNAAETVPNSVVSYNTVPLQIDTSATMVDVPTIPVDESNIPATTEETESASGASTVAIDNKIEQAMDLVKSHLMFAVREEVEVLKEKISELMDRINQLEYENNILRAHASPDTLNMLTNQQPPKIQAPTSTTS